MRRPPVCTLMVNVAGIEECNQHVYVEQRGAHSESRRRLTTARSARALFRTVSNQGTPLRTFAGRREELDSPCRTKSEMTCPAVSPRRAVFIITHH